MTLYYLFNAPITLADLHYLSPIDFIDWSKKLKMNLEWKTLNHSWAYGDFLVRDFKRRLPKVLTDAKLPTNKKRINKFIKWLEKNVLSFDNSLSHNGAMGLYVFSLK